MALKSWSISFLGAELLFSINLFVRYTLYIIKNKNILNEFKSSLFKIFFILISYSFLLSIPLQWTIRPLSRYFTSDSWNFAKDALTGAW